MPIFAPLGRFEPSLFGGGVAVGVELKVATTAAGTQPLFGMLNLGEGFVHEVVNVHGGAGEVGSDTEIGVGCIGDGPNLAGLARHALPYEVEAANLVESFIGADVPDIARVGAVDRDADGFSGPVPPCQRKTSLGVVADGDVGSVGRLRCEIAVQRRRRSRWCWRLALQNTVH